MKYLDTINPKAGSTLVTLLTFIVVATTVTTAASMVIMNNTLNASKFEQGQAALYVAESGAENALLRLLRNPTYTGEVLQIGDGTATITVTTSGSNKTIVSIGEINNFRRKIQINAGYSSGILAITPPWQEVQ